MSTDRQALALRAARNADETMICVWRFEDAPSELRELSEHGGDEDWLAVFPAEMRDESILWCEEGTGFGPCEVSEHFLDDGRTVRIGAHA